METINIDDVQKMAETIDTLGAGIMGIAIIFVVFLVLMSVGIGLFCKMAADQRKQNEAMRATQAEQFQQMFNQIIQNKYDGGIFKKSLNISAAAEEQLKYACGVTKCDRVAIYVFHNGVRALNGSHLLKTSCLIEYAPLNQYCYISQSKDIPINQILEVCNSLDEIGSYTCWDTDTLDDASSLKSWLKGRHIKSVVANAIYDNNGHPIGFACSEFMLAEPDEDNHEYIFDRTKELADKMAIVMNLNLLKQE